ncbi:MAG: cation-transporting P-type ATPase, partial [Acinetobacter baumannii]|nr:cation-transporting P-type ATPase [Acinetobacter baumannii]
LNEVTHEKPLTWWQHLWYCYRNPFNILLSLLGVCHPKSVPRNWPEL